MAWNYSEKTQQLFMDAVQGKPGTHLGEIEEPDGLGEHGSIACGDALRFTFAVERHPSDPTKDVISEAKYLTFGCTSAIAASEALCAIIEQGGYSPIQALEISNQDIVAFLEGLPDQKIHCSVMGAEALEAAVFDWARKRGVDLELLGIDQREEEREEGRLLCECFSVTEPYLRSPTPSRRAGLACPATTFPAGCRTSSMKPGALLRVIPGGKREKKPRLTRDRRSPLISSARRSRRPSTSTSAP
jgi:NifU-like protein